jgi:CRP/FNR family cyclic AMP-dependent transcriptional regulator
MGTQDLAHVLARFTYFEGLSQQTLGQMAEHTQVCTCSEGQVILLVGEPSEAVYLIAQGNVHIRRLSPEGREYVLHALGPGEGFNFSSVLDGGRNLASASALTDALLYAISSDVFCQVVRRHPDLAVALLGHLAGRMRRLYDEIEDLALHTVRTRLARRLLSATNGDAPTIQYWTHDEIARHIGTVRDVVGRTLRAFVHEGLIQRERGRLIVTDTTGLRREAMYG